MIQLTNLLTAGVGNPIAAECLERIKREESLKYRDDCLIPLAQTLDIYSTRAKINAKRGGKVEGYDQLLPSLEGASVPSVRLHVLEFLSHWYIAFTDETSSHLFGILKSKKQKDARFDPVKGHDV